MKLTRASPSFSDPGRVCILCIDHWWLQPTPLLQLATTSDNWMLRRLDAFEAAVYSALELLLYMPLSWITTLAYMTGMLESARQVTRHLKKQHGHGEPKAILQVHYQRSESLTDHS